ncbi:MAG: hypothetical protein HKL91_09015 [Candidatus Eremiobacteraeota bacterium]|uniref:DNA polymerase III delta N-terminal domain-containing protein n=1 Tax=mine drainage metagenome TaxID=410659 RepID=E6PEA7_9ZZZZ|nr:hypothetical protein [Candidatus Eremiobacteraeota bacterium]
MKAYDFLDEAPKVGALVVIEGTDRLLAERVRDTILARELAEDVRALNCSSVTIESVDDCAQIEEAISAMPFLAARRVVIVNDAQSAKAAPRRALLELAQRSADGENLLLICDLVAPRSTRPASLGSQLGRSAQRIDCTANEEIRARFVAEELAAAGAEAERQVLAHLSRSESDLASIRNDLAKLALLGRKIQLGDLEQESLAVDDPKPYRFAGALVEGRVAEAFAILGDCFEHDPRNAAMPLLSALANEYAMLWEMARPGGTLPPRMAWRERALRPIARRVGERRARAGYERALRGIESIVTGRAGGDLEDLRLLVERTSLELVLR